MAFPRRIKVLCSVCSTQLVQRSDESRHSFNKRKTCSPECAAELKRRKQTVTNKCLCGKPPTNNTPYCSWDCRLIAIKCKQWGIPYTIEDYNKKAAQLSAAQREIDMKFRSID